MNYVLTEIVYSSVVIWYFNFINIKVQQDLFFNWKLLWKFIKENKKLSLKKKGLWLM